MLCAALSSMRSCHLPLWLFGINHQPGTSSSFTAPLLWGWRKMQRLATLAQIPTTSTLCSCAHASPHFPSSWLSNFTQLSKSQGLVSSSSGWGCPNFSRWLHLYHEYHQVTFCCPLSYFPVCCQGNCWSWRTANTSSLKNGKHCY